MRDNGYWVVEAMDEQPGEDSFSIGVVIPQVSGLIENKMVKSPQFTSLWSGGALGFEKINTALICFSILAREHKIKVTQDRLIHKDRLTSFFNKEVTILEEIYYDRFNY